MSALSLLTISRILGEVEGLPDARLCRFLVMKAGCLPSMPESRTAQTILLQSTLNSERAASAFTAGTDRSSAGRSPAVQ